MSKKIKTDSRLAIAMWDFSWLTRMTGEEAEYRNWDDVLDGLVERGYNCVRIDAFPHLVEAQLNGVAGNAITILPEPVSAQWGNSVPVTVDPKTSLRDFMSKAQERNLKVGLSSWFNPDSLDLRSTLRTSQDFARAWGETLKFLEDEGVSDSIVWVDLCNEFPFSGWATGVHQDIFGTKLSVVSDVRFFGRWTNDALHKTQTHIDQSIEALRQRFPDYKYTYSYMYISRKNFYRLNYKNFDVVEPHVWLTDRLMFGWSSLGFLSMAQLPMGEYIHSKVAPYVFGWARKYWLSMLDKHMSELSEWSIREGMPLYTSEGWATVMYGGVSDSQQHWCWVKEICEAAVYMAIDKGWVGICTSNFSQPHFKGMWEDVEWHQSLTKAIRRG